MLPTRYGTSAVGWGHREAVARRLRGGGGCRAACETLSAGFDPIESRRDVADSVWYVRGWMGASRGSSSSTSRRRRRVPRGLFTLAVSNNGVDGLTEISLRDAVRGSLCSSCGVTLNGSGKLGIEVAVGGNSSGCCAFSVLSN